MTEFGLRWINPGETVEEYQARLESYRRQDRDQLPRDIAWLAAAGRREEHFVTASGNKMPVYHTDRSEEAIRQLVRRMYSASWAR